ncbi:hypothetical protein JHK87_040144 [Glycine soja]|nr:hypothetical protein JHK87_040144 [Glycine soja]
MKKLARKLHNEEDEHLSLLVHDRDSHSLDPQDLDFDAQSKKSWFVLLKGVKLSRVAYRGSILLLHRVSFVLHLPTGFISVGTTVSRLLHGGDLLVDDYICMFTSLVRISASYFML